MKTYDLRIEPTAWRCSICLEGKEGVDAEPDLFDQLVQFQEDTRSVLFAHFDEGPQHICEVCSNGHVLCRKCADTCYQENDVPTCPSCRGEFLYPPSARTLQVFDRTPAEKLATKEEQAMVLQRHDLIA